MIKTTTIVNKKLQNELSKKYVILSSVLITLGVFGVLMYAFRAEIFGLGADGARAFIIFVIPLGVGLLMTYLVAKTKGMTSVEEKTISYEFSDEGFTAEVTRGDEVKTLTFAYSDIVKTKRTGRYAFIYCKKDASYPVDLKNMSKDDADRVKQLLKIK